MHVTEVGWTDATLVRLGFGVLLVGLTAVVWRVRKHCGPKHLRFRLAVFATLLTLTALATSALVITPFDLTYHKVYAVDGVVIRVVVAFDHSTILQLVDGTEDYDCQTATCAGITSGDRVLLYCAKEANKNGYGYAWACDLYSDDTTDGVTFGRVVPECNRDPLTPSLPYQLPPCGPIPGTPKHT